MSILKLKKTANTNENCIKSLNESVGKKNWELLYDIGVVKCFINEEKQVVTIADATDQDDDCYDTIPHAFVGVNVENEIKAILEMCKFYYTCDYGEVFYNPYTKALHIVSSDCGYGYTKGEIPLDEDGEVDFEQFMTDSFIEFNEHPETSFIKEVEWADEYYPDEKEFMLIGRIVEAC